MKSTKKKLLITGAVLLLAGLGTIYYLFNMPKRNVSKSDADHKIEASVLVREYLKDEDATDARYLKDDGVSDIMDITGTLSKIEEDYNNQLVLLLQESDDPTGVSVTLQNGEKPRGLKVGQTIRVKGVIRSGAHYDEDLGFYEPVIIEDATILKSK